MPISLEFVLSRQTKATFPRSLPLAALLDDAIFSRGALVYSGFGKGTADGIVGDHILLSPPLSITSSEVELIVQAVKQGVEDVFSSERVMEVVRQA